LQFIISDNGAQFIAEAFAQFVGFGLRFGHLVLGRSLGRMAEDQR